MTEIIIYSLKQQRLKMLHKTSVFTQHHEVILA